MEVGRHRSVFSFVLPSTFYLLSSISGAWAQFDFQLGITPEGIEYEREQSTGAVKYPIDPFAANLADEIFASKGLGYWESIGISTGSPAQDLTHFVRRGFGRLELTTLMVIASQRKLPLKELAQKRIKGGRLRELAVGETLEYDKVRWEAKTLKETVVLKMKTQTVSQAPQSSSSAAKSQDADSGEGKK